MAHCWDAVWENARLFCVVAAGRSVRNWWLTATVCGCETADTEIRGKKESPTVTVRDFSYQMINDFTLNAMVCRRRISMRTKDSPSLLHSPSRELLQWPFRLLVMRGRCRWALRWAASCLPSCHGLSWQLFRDGYRWSGMPSDCRMEPCSCWRWCRLQRVRSLPPYQSVRGTCCGGRAAWSGCLFRRWRCRSHGRWVLLRVLLRFSSPVLRIPSSLAQGFRRMPRPWQRWECLRLDYEG